MEYADIFLVLVELWIILLVSAFISNKIFNDSTVEQLLLFLSRS